MAKERQIRDVLILLFLYKDGLPANGFANRFLDHNGTTGGTFRDAVGYSLCLAHNNSVTVEATRCTNKPLVHKLSVPELSSAKATIKPTAIVSISKPPVPTTDKA